MTDTLRLPEKTRARLAELYRMTQQAQRDFQGSLLTVLEFFGLDPLLAHDINFETGILTPAPEVSKPTLVPPVDTLDQVPPSEPLQ